MKNQIKKLNTYLVGGAVRDGLLDRSVQDRDWVVVGSSVAEMRKLGFQSVGRDFPVFLHPDTKEEYALARTERKRGSGHRGFVVDANPDVTLEEDLSRRDLTINAIAQSPDGELVDPFMGVTDLERGKLRHVSEAFVEDPLRVFRVARFAAQLPDFEVVGETNDLMARVCASGELVTLAAERVWQEMHKALAAERPQQFFNVLEACGGLHDWMVELEDRDTRFTQGDAIDRFAELPISESQILTLARRLKAPVGFRRTALHHRKYAAVLAEWTSCSADDLVNCLTDLRVVHQLDDLERLLALTLRHRDYDAEGLRALVRSFLGVTIEESVSGSEYGNALRAARVTWLNEYRSGKNPALN